MKGRTVKKGRDNGIPLSDDDLRRHLEEQIMFLQTSCDAFDQGNLAEAKRLAATLRLLLHDTATSHSLLGQLGMKGGKFADSATGREPAEGLPRPDASLVSLMMRGDQAILCAPFDAKPIVLRTFEEWWTMAALTDKSGQTFSRRDLVLTAANKDGGAHVDPNIDTSYRDLSIGRSLGFEVHRGEAPETISEAQLGAIRQIAHEVLKTLVPGYAREHDPHSYSALIVHHSGDPLRIMVLTPRSRP